MPCEEGLTEMQIYFIFKSQLSVSTEDNTAELSGLKQRNVTLTLRYT